MKVGVQINPDTVTNATDYWHCAHATRPELRLPVDEGVTVRSTVISWGRCEYDIVVIVRPGRTESRHRLAKASPWPSSNAGRMLGGACVNTGTIPSKRCVRLCSLTGMNQRELGRRKLPREGTGSPRPTCWRGTQHVIGKEVDVVQPDA